MPMFIKYMLFTLCILVMSVSVFANHNALNKRTTKILNSAWKSTRTRSLSLNHDQIMTYGGQDITRPVSLSSSAIEFYTIA